MSIGGVVIQFRADADQARREIRKLNSSVASVATAAKKTDKNLGAATSGKATKKGAKAWGKFATIAGAAGVAGVAAGATASIVGMGASIIRTSANFEQSQNILKATTDASAAEMKKLSDTAKKMGAATVFSALDASDAMVELAKAGLTTEQIMGGGVQSAMNLAATEGLELADAATAVANAMAAFGLKSSDLPAVADALAGASKSSTASVGSLMDALQQVGPGARNAGLSLQDTVSVLAAFDSMGLKGSDAGTSLKTMLNRLVPQTKKARAAFATYGLAVYDAAKAQKNLSGLIKPKSWAEDDVDAALADMYRKNGLEGTAVGTAVDKTMWESAYQNQLANKDGSFKDPAQWAGLLADNLGKLSEVDLTEATNLLFGSDAGRAGSIFARLGTEGLQPFIDGANDAGAAAEMANARTAGFNGAIEALKGSLETMAISVGENLLPKLTEFVDYLNKEALPRLSAWLESSEGQQAIDTWAQNFASLGGVIQTIIENLDKLFGLLNKLPGNIILQKLGLIPKFGDAPKPEDIPKAPRPDWLKNTEAQVASGVGSQQVPKGTTINIYNPTPTKAEDSAALALRINRANSGR